MRWASGCMEQKRAKWYRNVEEKTCPCSVRDKWFIISQLLHLSGCRKSGSLFDYRRNTALTEVQVIVIIYRIMNDPVFNQVEVLTTFALKGEKCIRFLRFYLHCVTLHDTRLDELPWDPSCNELYHNVHHSDIYFAVYFWWCLLKLDLECNVLLPLI